MSTNAIPLGGRVDLWDVVLKVAGLPDIRCRNKTGGAADSEETRERPGGAFPEESLGGRASVENVTVTVSMAICTPATYRSLRGLVGRAVGEVYEVPLDANRVAFGAEALVGRGTLKRVGGLETDANGSDAQTFEVEVTVTSDSAGGGA